MRIGNCQNNKRHEGFIGFTNNPELFTKNYSFPETIELMRISTGITAPPYFGTNCDRANEIGAQIQQFFNNQTYTFVKASRKGKDVS